MPADIVFRGGVVLSMDPHVPEATAVAVRNGRVAVVGSDHEIDRQIGPSTSVVDLEGRTLMPGINDSHCHPMGFGASLGWIDASPTNVRSISEVSALFGRAASRAKPGSWLRGRGYDDTRLHDHRHPTRWDLDATTGDFPALLTRTCGHMSVANSVALDLAGITANTPDPVGGEIDRNDDGEPTGLLREHAQGLVRQLIPRPTVSDIKQAIVAAGNKFLTMGITSVAEAGISSSDQLQAYQELRKSAELPVRTYLMMMIDDTLEPLAKLGIRTGFGDEWLRVGPAKLLQDGSGGGRTAAMTRHYPDQPDNFGITIYTQDELDEKFTVVARAGFQGAAHAIGDKAIDMIITAYERALAQYPQRDARWRIEHCGMMTPRLLARMKQLELLAIPQPAFIYYLGDSYLENFSEDALDLAYPSRSWFDLGITAIGSSDTPVVPADPWMNIRAAVTRLTQDGQMMGPSQGVSIEEALRMFTVHGAIGSFEESIKGSIAPGKLADLIVIDQDPRTIDPAALHTIRTDLTMIDGKIVFER